MRVGAVGRGPLGRTEHVPLVATVAGLLALVLDTRGNIRIHLVGVRTVLVTDIHAVPGSGHPERAMVLSAESHGIVPRLLAAGASHVRHMIGVIDIAIVAINQVAAALLDVDCRVFIPAGHRRGFLRIYLGREGLDGAEVLLGPTAVQNLEEGPIVIGPPVTQTVQDGLEGTAGAIAEHIIVRSDGILGIPRRGRGSRAPCEADFPHLCGDSGV